MRAICCAILALVFLQAWLTLARDPAKAEQTVALFAEVLCFASICAAIVLCILGL